MNQETKQSVFVTYGNHPALYQWKEDIPVGMEYQTFRGRERAISAIYNYGCSIYHDYTGDVWEQNVIKQQSGIRNSDEAVAYINGRYNRVTGHYGVGIVFVYAGGIEEFSEDDSDAIYGMQHITGELKAAIKAVVFAILLELKKITIVYGYLGVEKLGNGEWYGNQPFTEEYRNTMYEASMYLDIRFCKADKTSMLRGCERASILAKQGCAA